MNDNVNAGTQAYPDGDSVQFELGTDSAGAGDAVTVGSSGTLVTTTGSNGFVGILGRHESYASGDMVTLHLSGVVKAAVASGVAAGDAMVAGASGELTTGANPAEAGDAIALTDRNSDGYALVHLG